MGYRNHPLKTVRLPFAEDDAAFHQSLLEPVKPSEMRDLSVDREDDTEPANFVSGFEKGN
jgi:hypothetical protein